MNNRLKFGAGLVGVWLVAGGAFLAAGGAELFPDRPAATPIATAAIQGNFGKYLYAISDISNRPSKLAQFDPSLPTDDAVVVDTLRALAKDAYGMKIGDEIAPAVETINEVNYVTFTTADDKVLFELFRNSSGEVGTAHFMKVRPTR